MPISIRSVNLRGYYTIPYQLPNQEQAKSGTLLLRRLMVNLVLGNISLQERQERVSRSCSRSDVTSVSSGGGGGMSGNRLRRIVLGEFRSEVGGKGRSLW
jgi:hypothetical protein